MAEKLTLVLRALIFQANRHPGQPAQAHLTRGLELQVTRSPETNNFKIQCGRKKGYASEVELAIIAANWPVAHATAEWHMSKNPDEDSINWTWAIIKPITQEAPAESAAT